jgi:hypothetical protein
LSFAACLQVIRSSDRLTFLLPPLERRHALEALRAVSKAEHGRATPRIQKPACELRAKFSRKVRKMGILRNVRTTFRNSRSGRTSGPVCPVIRKLRL